MFFLKKVPYNKVDVIASIQIFREKLGYDEDELIFETACDIAYQLPEKEISKNYKKTNASKELLALNIIQNVAMAELQNASFNDILTYRTSANKIYEEINNLKYSLGLISKKQYDDNKKLGEQLLSRSTFR